MIFADFEKNTQTILTWFNKKLKPDQLEIMYRQVKHIPNEAYADIIEGLISDSKFFPTINDVKSRWWKWREQHPEKIAPIPRTPCIDCEGEGLLYIYQEIKGGGGKPYRDAGPYHQVVRCRACENWKRHFSEKGPVPIYYRTELEARGYKVEPDIKNPKPAFHSNGKTLKDLTNSVFRDVRDYNPDETKNKRLQKLKKQAATITDEIPF